MTFNINTRRRYPAIIDPKVVPTYSVELDISLAPRGLALCIPFFASSLRDLVSGVQPVITGTAGIANTPAGPGFDASAGGTLGYLLAGPPQIFSIEAYVYSSSNVTTGQVISTFYNASNVSTNVGTDRALVAGVVPNYGPGGVGVGVANKYSGYIYDGFGEVVTESGSDFQATTLTHLVLTANGSNISLYVNGAPAGTKTTGSAVTYSPSYLLVGNATFAAPHWTGQVLLMNVATVAWTAAEVAQRYAEPFGMLLPTIKRARRTIVSGAFTGSWSDLISPSDLFNGTGQSPGTWADTLATSDTYTGLGLLPTTWSDNLAPSDQFLSTLFGVSSWSDSIIVSDLFSNNISHTGSWSDSLGLADSYGSAVIMLDGYADTIVPTDTYNISGTFASSWSDNISASDLYSGSYVVNGVWADTLGLADSYHSVFSALDSWTDNLTPEDEFLSSASFAYSWSDTLTPSDIFTTKTVVFILGIPIIVLPATRDLIVSPSTRTILIGADT